jgi:hypothetical protein
MMERSTHVEKVVKVVLVFIVIKATAILADLAAFSIALWLEHESWLKEDLAGVLINLLEPVPQLLVPVRVVVKRIDRILDQVHALAVSEPFE